MAELVEAVRLAAEGKIRVLVDRTAPLDAVNEELERLRRGRWWAE